MSINLDKFSDKEEYNILLLGLTFAGKSTFINAFVNYIKFGSLNEALGAGCEEVIATRFRLWDDKTGEYNEIRSGKDENELDTEYDYYTKTQKPRIHSIRHNGKHIRLIDAPGVEWNYYDGPDNNYLHTISQFLIQIPKLHAVVVMTRGIDFSYYELSILQTIHKSTFENVVFCYIKDVTFKTNDNYTLEKFKLNIQKCTKIRLQPGKNLICIDNCAFQCLVAHKQKHIFSDERMSEYTESWIKATNQIQTMLNWVASRKACKTPDMVELMQSCQIVNSCLGVIWDETTDNTQNSCCEAHPNSIGNLFKQSPNEYERIEDICAKSWGMVIYSSVVSWDGFQKLLGVYKDIHIHDTRPFNFLIKQSNICSNGQSFEEQFSQHSSSDNFKELFGELKKLEQSGSFFTEQIDKITATSNNSEFKEIPFEVNDEFSKFKTKLEDLVQLQKILSVVSENNLLLVDMKSESATKCNLTNATLENVVFLFGKSTNQMRDFIVNKTNTNLSQTDIELILTNIDLLIKSNFENLSHVIRNATLQQVVKNEEMKRYNLPEFISNPSNLNISPCKCTLPDVVSQFRPYMQHHYQQSNIDRELSNKVDLIVEQMLKLKVELQNARNNE